MAVLKEKSQQVWNVLSGRPILFFGLFAALILLGVTIYQAFHMELYFPSTILILAGVGIVGLALALYLIVFQPKQFGKVLSWILILAVSGASFYFMHSMYSLQTMIGAMCAPMWQDPQTMSIYCSKQAPVSDLSRLNNSKVGFLQGRNDQGNQQVIDDLAGQDIHIEPMYYPNIEALFTALKVQGVSAICLNDYDMDLMDLLDPSASNRKATDLIDTIEYPIDPLSGDPSIDVALQPFTALIKISGSIKQDMVDDLALAAINPTTKICKIFLVPRDYWIPYGCENGACSFDSDKLAFLGYFSDQQLINAISSLLGVPINFMVDVSLDTLLDSVSGKTLSLHNPTAFSYGMTSFSQGDISINVEQAKLFAGMFDLSGLDRTYMHNAYLVLKALWMEYPIKSLDLISGELGRLNQSIRTDFSYQQFLHLIETLTYVSSQWQFSEEELTGIDQTFYSALLTGQSYGIAPDSSSLDSARVQIEQILAIASQEIQPAPEVLQEQLPQEEYDESSEEEYIEESQEYLAEQDPGVIVEEEIQTPVEEVME